MMRRLLKDDNSPLVRILTQGVPPPSKPEPRGPRKVPPSFLPPTRPVNPLLAMCISSLKKMPVQVLCHIFNDIIFLLLSC